MREGPTSQIATVQKSSRHIFLRLLKCIWAVVEIFFFFFSYSRNLITKISMSRNVITGPFPPVYNNCSKNRLIQFEKSQKFCQAVAISLNTVEELLLEQLQFELLTLFGSNSSRFFESSSISSYREKDKRIR
jgi:hypothetical protein